MNTTRRTRPRNRRANGTKNMISALRLRPQHTRTRGSLEPPAVLDTIVISYRFQLTVPVLTATTVLITPKDLIDGVPGGDTTWNTLRILHVEAWGPDSSQTALLGLSSLTLGILSISSTGITTDQAVFIDTGTMGAQRSHISIRPGSLFELAWFNTDDDTTNVISIATSAAATVTDQVTLQVSVELRSNTN
jgi:hypothetical protein